MAAFCLRRLAGAALVCVLISVIVFTIFVVAPGGGGLGAAQRIAGKNATSQNVHRIEQQWGFDKPLYVQYVRLMEKMFTGSLVSYTTQQSVVRQIWRGLPATVSLAVGAAVIWMLFGIALGLISAVLAGRIPDRIITVFALLCVSMPVFWLGVLCRYYFAEGGISTVFPDGGYVPLTAHPVGWLSHMLLPWAVLSAVFAGFYSRVLRSSIRDTIHDDFVRTAYAKGLSQRRVIVRHVLRASLIPVVSLFGLDVAGVIGGGAILTETVFDLHGVGQYAAQSINNFDLPPIMAVTLYGAMFVVLFSAIIDILYTRLDPRISLN